MAEPTRRAAEPAPVSEVARLERVSFGYEGAPGVLRGVNLSVPAGSFHFLTGPSGAGKTSLLRLLTLTARPTEGRVRLFGQDVTDASRRDLPALRRRMGVVFQDFRLLDHLTVFDNVALPLRLAGRSEADYEPDVREMLAWVGLAKRMDAYPPQLSGGEQQRLAIARAVVVKPELVLADEPTASVDAAMADRLLGLFQALNRLGVAVVIATHDKALAERAGATVLRIEKGRLS